MKNGAELLDRLVKDIVSESAATYVSVLATSPEFGDTDNDFDHDDADLPTAFSLKRFIPLLKDRIFVLNPFTRTFLVGWIVLLDSIPDLELVAYLPEFLGGLLTFLSDTNRDVHIATQNCLDKFLSEIRRIARIKKGIAESRKSNARDEVKRKNAGQSSVGGGSIRGAPSGRGRADPLDDAADAHDDDEQNSGEGRGGAAGGDDNAYEEDEESDENEDDDEDDESNSEDDWVPGQDVQINYAAILVILTSTLDSPQGTLSLISIILATASVCLALPSIIVLTSISRMSLGEDGLLESLRWIVEFLDICPEEVLPFSPKILAHLLPAMASGIESIRVAAARVNSSLMNYVVSLPVDQEANSAPAASLRTNPTAAASTAERQDASSTRASLSSSRDVDMSSPASSLLLQTRAASSTTAVTSAPRRTASPATASAQAASDLQPAQQPDLDYTAAVSSLTLLFLNDHEATRVAALTWLIMLHRKAPRKVLAFNDGTFPALLKTLSDPAEAVVTKDLQLLSQISRNSEDDYFSNFMINLLQLFSTDRKLLETRGNLIIRQLCVSLSPERIYRSLANCIEREEDVEFASIMVQNLNNNLLTAPELADVRKRLRNLETKDGQTFFVALFRSWCYNAVATFSLCLLAQAYEQAYNLLQILFVPFP